MSEHTAVSILNTVMNLASGLSRQPTAMVSTSSGPPECLADVVANFQTCSSISGTCAFLSRQYKHFPTGDEKAILALWNESQRHAEVARRYKAGGEESGAEVHSRWSQVFWDAGERVKVGTLDGFTSDGKAAGTERGRVIETDVVPPELISLREKLGWVGPSAAGH